MMIMLSVGPARHLGRLSIARFSNVAKVQLVQDPLVRVLYEFKAFNMRLKGEVAA